MSKKSNESEIEYIHRIERQYGVTSKEIKTWAKEFEITSYEIAE